MMLVSGGEGSHQTYQNIESAGLNFVRHTLLPWMRRLEDGLGKMFPFPIVLRFNADSLQRADRMTRAKAQQIQIMSGVLSPNEVREEEGLEPYEGGDSFYSPSQTPSIGTDAIPPEPAQQEEQA
jgi:phage portal protein BeeE